jgi:hypothetical protein
MKALFSGKGSTNDMYIVGIRNNNIRLTSAVNRNFHRLARACWFLSPRPVRQALDATLLAGSWNFQHALGDFNSLNYLAGCPTLSLCLVLGRASTLLTLRSWLLLKHGALFLLLFCDTLSANTLLVLRSWLRLTLS